jgi:hypothetical protein
MSSNTTSEAPSASRAETSFRLLGKQIVAPMAQYQGPGVAVEDSHE